MEMPQKERVEILKKSFAVWPNITVRDSGILSDGIAIKVRTALTLLRLKKDNEYQLVEVRYDQQLPQEDAEHSWVEGFSRFLYKISATMKYWDGTNGITDNNQND